MKHLLLSLLHFLLLSSASCIFAFTPPDPLYLWWEQNVDWYTYSHHSEYITMSSDKMGPNALPVPNMRNGSIDTVSYIALGGTYHHYTPDPTQNITLYVNYPVIKNFISVDLDFLIQEFYNSKITQASHDLKTERNVFHEHYYDKNAVGDVNFQVNFQFSQQEKAGVDFMGTVSYRFASSANVSAARFIDAPGYFFSLSLGKKLIQKEDYYLKMISNVGFLVYQTNDEQHSQNDAFYYAGGVEANYKGWRLTNSIEGYYGYFGNGDRPLLFRSSVRKNWDKLVTSLRFQTGVQDFRYNSFELVFGYKLDFLPSFKIEKIKSVKK
ncbi:MAG: hypothetical protein AB8B61_00175 [Cyclobacteriaceae bacterium]